MASVSSVTINMPAATVEALLAGNFSLYAFKAVEAFPSGGSPLVWQATQEIMQVVEIQWSDQVQAYTSQSSIQINNQITPGFTTNIAPGQTLQVGSSGSGSVTGSGGDGAIAIANQSSSMMTCGIAQSGSPLCAFLLQGNTTQRITPLDKVVFMFSTATVSAGTVITQALSNAILIDLQQNKSAQVSFDINNGWSGGGSSTQNVAANANLTALLILKE